jgi:hypothetical protein
MSIDRGEQLKVRVSDGEKALIERAAEVEGESMSEWTRDRVYDAGWRLVWLGDDTLYEFRHQLELESLLESLVDGRWFDAELLRGSDNPDEVVRRFTREFVPEQLARLAGMPRGGGLDEAVEVLRQLDED